MASRIARAQSTASRPPEAPTRCSGHALGAGHREPLGCVCSEHSAKRLELAAITHRCRGAMGVDIVEIFGIELGVGQRDLHGTLRAFGPSARLLPHGSRPMSHRSLRSRPGPVRRARYRPHAPRAPARQRLRRTRIRPDLHRKDGWQALARRCAETQRPSMRTPRRQAAVMAASAPPATAASIYPCCIEAEGVTNRMRSGRAGSRCVCSWGL